MTTFEHRKPNFTNREICTLIQEISNRKNVLLRKGGNIHLYHQKQKKWEEIEDIVNGLGESAVHRTVKELRKKWDYLVFRAKKDYQEIRASEGEINGTQVSPYTQLVINVFGSQSDMLSSSSGGEGPDAMSDESIEASNQEEAEDWDDVEANEDDTEAYGSFSVNAV